MNSSPSKNLSKQGGSSSSPTKGFTAGMLLIVLSTMNGPLPIAAVIPDCSSAMGTSCMECMAVDYSCAWAEGACLNSCYEIADAACYGADTFPGHTPEEICEIEDIDAHNKYLCTSQHSCGDCTGTTFLDGYTTCSWYDVDGYQFCDSDPGLWWTDSPPVSECPPANPCEGASSCTDCLARSDECAWNGGQCFDGCLIADTPCYNAENFPNHTPEAICLVEETTLADQALCARQSSDCLSCVDTVQSDGTPCYWFGDPAVSGGIGFCSSEPSLWYQPSHAVTECILD